MLAIVSALRPTEISGVAPEIMRQFRVYSALAMARLTGWAFAIGFYVAGIGCYLYFCATLALHRKPSAAGWRISAIAAILIAFALQTSRRLVHIPSSVSVCFPKSISTLRRLRKLLGPRRVQAMDVLVSVAAGALIGAGLAATRRDLPLFLATAAAGFAFAAVLVWANWDPRPKPVAARHNPAQPPNILMIGCDTMRADRWGASGYPRDLTPQLDQLATRGTLFLNCFVPMGRTAPSLATIFSGVWPQRHRILCNLVPDDETTLPVECLPKILTDAGYRTATVSDWSGGDLGKLSFGFEDSDVPPDEWNLRYRFRQGPRLLRYFLSLFTHNRFGHDVLPEMFYLRDIPLGSYIRAAACRKLSELAAAGQPFLLNVYAGSAHPGFGSEYPYYTLFTDPEYRGESQFCMAGLTTPRGYIDKLKSGEFPDLTQVRALYDGGIRSFDDLAGSVVRHLEACGLRENTIVVIYADHGLDLFERGSWGQGSLIDGDYSSRTALLVIDPAHPEAAVVNDVVRSVDIAPTLLDLAGLPVPEQMCGVPLMSHEVSSETPLNLTAFSETGLWVALPPGTAPDHLAYPNLLEVAEVPDVKSGTAAIKTKYANLVHAARDRMLRTDRWKLIYRPLIQGARWELYDIQADPGCLAEVGTGHPEILAELKTRLIGWLTAEPGWRFEDDHVEKVVSPAK